MSNIKKVEELVQDEVSVEQTLKNEDVASKPKASSNPVKGKSIAALKFVAKIMYKNDMGGRSVKDVEMTVPYVDNDYIMVAAMKMGRNILAKNGEYIAHIFSVRIVGEIKKTTMIPTFLEKNISELNELEIIMASIYYKFRTVKNCDDYSLSDMQNSLAYHYHNKEKTDDINTWEHNYSTDIKIKEIK